MDIDGTGTHTIPKGGAQADDAEHAFQTRQWEPAGLLWDHPGAPGGLVEPDGVMTEGDWKSIEATAMDRGESDETETSTEAGGQWRPMGASS